MIIFFSHHSDKPKQNIGQIRTPLSSKFLKQNLSHPLPVLHYYTTVLTTLSRTKHQVDQQLVSCPIRYISVCLKDGNQSITSETLGHFFTFQHAQRWYPPIFSYTLLLYSEAKPFNLAPFITGVKVILLHISMFIQSIRHIAKVKQKMAKLLLSYPFFITIQQKSNMDTFIVNHLPSHRTLQE